MATIPDWAFKLADKAQRYRIFGSAPVDVAYHGQRPIPRAGRGMEWFGRREYVPGDPLNIIDWRSLSRHSHIEEPQMFVKTFDVELANLTTIVIDCSASMDTWGPKDGKFSTALGVAALLGWSAVNHDDPIEFVFIGGLDDDLLYSTGLIHSPVEYESEIKALNSLSIKSSGSLSWDILIDPVIGLKGTRHTIILIGDFFNLKDEVVKLMNVLKQIVQTVLAIRILSPKDENPFESGQDIELWDIEDPSSTCEINFDLNAYRLKFHNHLNDIADLFMAEGVRFADLLAIPGDYNYRSKKLVSPDNILNRLIKDELLL